MNWLFARLFWNSRAKYWRSSMELPSWSLSVIYFAMLECPSSAPSPLEIVALIVSTCCSSIHLRSYFLTSVNPQTECPSTQNQRLSTPCDLASLWQASLPFHCQSDLWSHRIPLAIRNPCRLGNTLQVSADCLSWSWLAQSCWWATPNSRSGYSAAKFPWYSNIGCTSQM